MLRTDELRFFFGFDWDLERLIERSARCDDIILTYAEVWPSFYFDLERFLTEAFGDRSKEELRKDAFGFLPQASIVFDLSTNCI